MKVESVQALTEDEWIEDDSVEIDQFGGFPLSYMHLFKRFQEIIELLIKV